jgi:hypothetical protein
VGRALQHARRFYGEGLDAHLSINAPEQATRASFALDAMARAIEEFKAGKSSARDCVERATGARIKYPSLLGGFVFDAAGERLTPTYAIKKGTRYRYYVSSSLVREARGNRAGGWRLPAGDFEGLVISRLRNFFADPAALLDAVDNDPPIGLGQSQLIKRDRQIADFVRRRQTRPKRR